MDPTQKSKRPSDNKVKQQKMWAFKPKYTVRSLLIIFGALAILFFVLGGVALGMALQVSEYVTRYDHKCEINSECELKFKLDSSLSGPVYFYYELENFY